MTRQEEVDRNYDAFSKLLPEISAAHRDEFALMKNGEILGFHASAEEARVSADTLAADGLYSIQFVSLEPIDLGAYTHAVPVG